MKRNKVSGNNENAERNIFLLLLITILILYIAVPLYGVIQDERQGDAVFRIVDPLSGTGESLPDKIIDFFFGSKDIPVPVTRIFDLEGTVVYSDKTPYANGTVELMSTPRDTITTEDGYFIFRDVETGQHTISVLDGSGNILASCGIDISTDRNVGSHTIVSDSRGTYIIRVPVNVEMLEIQLVLKKGEDGSVQGISSLEIISVVTAQQSQPESPGKENPPGEVPELRDGEIPEPPAPGAISGGGRPTGGGGGEAGVPIPGPFRFSVYDGTVSFGGEAAHINIFGADKRIAPGQKGSYRFTVDNSRNSYSSLYTVEFTARDTLPAGSRIPIVYRLKAGNSYVAGNNEVWCDPGQLYQDRVVAENSSVVYTLEWYWRAGENDNLYAELSRSADYSYSLRIEVTAQRN